jgi:hypothetical protein
MPPVEFEPTISAGERPQIYALDRAAGHWHRLSNKLYLFLHDDAWPYLIMPDTRKEFCHAFNANNLSSLKNEKKFI